MTENRTERIKQPAYRVFIGKELRSCRIEAGYTLDNIKEMTGIPINSVSSMEKGELTNIDYYIVYAKAVKYPMATLKQAKIELKPLYTLSENKQKEVKLTNLIRIKIVKSGFLDSEKSVNEIGDELVRLKLILKEEVNSTAISGVMRNLKDDELVKVSRIVGKKNYYISNKI